MKIKTVLLHAWALLLLSLSLTSTASAQTTAPKAISYQGFLTDLTGTPLNGTYGLAFSFFETASGGFHVWTENHGNQTITNGNFSAVLSSVTAFPASLDFGKALWLEIQITPQGGSPVPLVRIPFESTPYANFAHDVADGAVTAAKLNPTGATADGQVLTYDAPTSSVTWSAPTTAIALPFSGTTSDPGTALSVINTGPGKSGFFQVDNTNGSFALSAQSNAANTASLYGLHTGWGAAGSFVTSDPNNTHETLSVTTAGKGVAGAFEIQNSTNDTTVVHAKTVGTGKAGWFEIDNPNSRGRALYAETNGLGWAGSFRQTNTNGSTALVAVTDGHGRAGYFEATNASNEFPAVQALTYGTGLSAFFDGGKGLHVSASKPHDEGGVTGENNVVAQFDGTASDSNTAMSINARGDQDAVLYFAKNGNAVWDIRNDAFDTSGNVSNALDFHYQGETGQNISMFRIQYNNVIHLNGDLLPETDDTYSLGVNSTRWTTVYATNGTIQTSDRRLKSHITDLGYGLDEVLALRPVAYQWKGKPEQGTKLGLIAQEVEGVISEVVNRPDDPAGYLGMNYAELVPVLIKALQEQQQIIQNQETTLTDVLARLTRLEAPASRSMADEE